MDAIQVEDAIVGEQRTFSPNLKLLSERVVEAAHCAGAGGHSRQRFSDFSDLMCACAADKHLRQCFCYLGFVPAIALKDLRMELSCAVSRHGEILNTPGLGHQVSCVRA